MWIFGKKPKAELPRKSVSVRMESIGGLGAHSAGKILAEAAVLGLGYTGNHFSSFGSEKKEPLLSLLCDFQLMVKLFVQLLISKILISWSFFMNHYYRHIQNV